MCQPCTSDVAATEDHRGDGEADACPIINRDGVVSDTSKHPFPRRRIVEIACWPNSQLCRPTEYTKNCDRIRITERHNFAQDDTVESILKMIRGKRLRMDINPLYRRMCI